MTRRGHHVAISDGDSSLEAKADGVNYHHGSLEDGKVVASIALLGDRRLVMDGTSDPYS